MREPHADDEHALTLLSIGLGRPRSFPPSHSDWSLVFPHVCALDPIESYLSWCSFLVCQFACFVEGGRASWISWAAFKLWEKDFTVVCGDSNTRSK